MTTCTVLQARRSPEANNVAFGNGKVDGFGAGLQAAGADVQDAGDAGEREQEVCCRHMTRPEL
jgi:hypothetical protein